MTAPSSRPDPPAQQHADTVREALNFGYGGDPNYRPFYEDGITALDALLAEVERLTAERDAANKLLHGLTNEDDANEAWKTIILRAEAAERERDAALGIEVEQVLADLKAAEALAERRKSAIILAASELAWCIGYAATAEHEAWRERLLKRLHIARAALADEGQG